MLKKKLKTLLLYKIFKLSPYFVVKKIRISTFNYILNEKMFKNIIYTNKFSIHAYKNIFGLQDNSQILPLSLIYFYNFSDTYFNFFNFKNYFSSNILISLKKYFFFKNFNQILLFDFNTIKLQICNTTLLSRNIVQIFLQVS
jgi:hypothetical protein